MTGFPIAEIFGPTLQGEGALAGRPTHFVRFGGCDSACVWCDSAHAVLAANVRLLPRMTEADIVDELARLGGKPEWVTLSGGNPALYDLTELVRRIKLNYNVAVETQGTVWKDWFHKVDLLTVSPKPPSSGNCLEVDDPMLQNLWFEFRGWPDRLALKVVIFTDEDYDYAKAVHLAYPQVPFYLSVGTYMGGLRGDYTGWESGVGVRIDTASTIIERWRLLAERADVDRAFGDVAVFAQLHAILWGPTTRGT